MHNQTLVFASDAPPCSAASANALTVITPAEHSPDAPLPAVIPFLFAAAERRRKRPDNVEQDDAAKIDHQLTKGAWGESVFQSHAIALGFTVFRAWNGQHSGLDFVLERDGRLLRVQVKSAWKRRNYHYFFPTTRNSVRHGRRLPYGRTIDFFCAFVAPLNAWYIVPASAIDTRTKGFCVYPLDGADRRDKRGNRRRRRTSFDYEVFRDKWNLLETAIGSW